MCDERGEVVCLCVREWVVCWRERECVCDERESVCVREKSVCVCPAVAQDHRLYKDGSSHRVLVFLSASCTGQSGVDGRRLTARPWTVLDASLWCRTWAAPMD